MIEVARGVRVRNARDRQRLRPRSLRAWEGVNEAIVLARSDRLAPDEAARRVGVSVASWRRYAPETLVRDRHGRLAVSAADRRYVGELRIATAGSVVSRPVRGSRKRSMLARHANAVRRYLETEDASGLDEFRGRRVAGLVLETDIDQLEDLARRGEFQWLDLYE